MLCSLRIQNFALIDRLELEFGAGLNVLTGETGAGKSIILDAIDITLGGKVNSRTIRQGANRAMLEATFGGNTALEQWLKEREIDLLEDNTVVCSRELAIAKGSLRSRSRVNGVLVNRKSMTQLRQCLVEITAQGQTIQLMISGLQRDLLDLYGGGDLLQQRRRCAALFETTGLAQKALEGRRKSEQQRLQRLDLVEYQLKELEAAELKDKEELEQRERERDRLSHVVELQQLSYQVYQALYHQDTEQSAAADLLGQGENILTNMVNYDPELEPILEMVQAALTQVVEAGQQINTYGDSLEVDPQRLGEVEERIGTLKHICRKYGPSLEEAISYYHKLQQELEELTDSGQSLEELEQEYQQQKAQLIKACELLTKLRQKAALALEKQLVGELKPLAMEKVIFQCRLSPAPPNASGGDKVEFYFSPNPGEKVQPLATTASGGEMSRFLLALKACFSNSEETGKTLIFDEIDAGVSGKVAQAIAAKLHQLSQKNQLLCVTHQPLIAAMADTHFRVDKEIISLTDNGCQIRTVVRVKTLGDINTRREELAELTGGHSAMEAIAFADSLPSSSSSSKREILGLLFVVAYLLFNLGGTLRLYFRLG